MLLSNGSSLMRDKFYLSSFKKDIRIFLCAPIIQIWGTHYSILSSIQAQTGIPVLMIQPNLKIMHGLKLFWINPKLNLMDLLICIGNMLTRLLYKAMKFTTLMPIPMMKITTSQLTVFFVMQLIFRIVSIVFSHIYFSNIRTACST